MEAWTAGAPVPTADPGDAACGPWQPGRLLARGRRSRVHLACDAGGAQVALKLLDGPRAGAEAAAQHAIVDALRHPHLMPVLAHGSRFGGAWLAMPLAEPLAPHLPGHPQAVLQCLHGAAAALEGLHAAGWVHGDVKPAHLLRDATGRLLLADLGSATRIGDHGPHGPGALLGSPRYASPEHLQGQAAQAAGDVYSLGVTVHELLLGAPAFSCSTLAEALAQHLLAPPAPLPAALAHWQPLLDAMLARQLAQRLPDGAALRDALDRIGPRAVLRHRTRAARAAAAGSSGDRCLP